MQVRHLDEENLFKLVEWNHCRGLVSVQKWAEAKEALSCSGCREEYLQAQWRDQVAAQTKPLARK
jgi:hypothetical protein